MYFSSEGIYLFITGHNTKRFKQSIIYNNMLIYSKLANEIKSVTFTMNFKKILFVLEKSFYPVEELMTIDP
jgi:hypothetical protein